MLTKTVFQDLEALPSSVEEPVVAHIPEEPVEAHTPPIYSRSGRRRKVPRAFQDFVPSSLSGLTTDLRRLIPPCSPQVPSPEIESQTHPSRFEVSPPVSDASAHIPLRSEPLHLSNPNDFGVFRVYTVRPRQDPEDEICPADLCDAPNIDAGGDPGTPTNPLRGFGPHTAASATRPDPPSWFAPFRNASICRLLWWKYSQSLSKSDQQINSLVHDVLKAPDFKLTDFEDFTSIEREEKRLDDHSEADGIFSAEDGWRKTSVEIKLPKEGIKYKSEDDIPTFEVKGLWYRRLVEVIRAAYTDCTQQSFHMIPFKLFHSTPFHIISDSC